MFARLSPTRLRHTIAGVLAAWLCVLLAGIAAPLAQAQHSQQHAVHLCSGELVPLDAPNPLADIGQAEVLDHALHCPLCLPVLAPPQPTWPPLSQQQPAEPVVGTLAGVHEVQAVVLPPTRAPPSKTWI